MAPLTLEIAGIACRLDTNGHPVISEAAGIYKAFLSETEPHVRVDLTVDADWPEQKPAPVKIVRDDGSLRIDSYNFHGAVTLRGAESKPGEAAGAGRATIAPEWASLDAFIRILYSMILPGEQGLLMHASAVVEDGGAYVFAGLPETGKSTVARLSRPRPVIGDELVALKVSDGRVWVHGTPFWNEPELSGQGGAKASPGSGAVSAPAGMSAPLRGLFLLVQDTRTYLRPLESMRALVELMPHIFYEPEQLELNQRTLDALANIVERTDCHRLHFGLDGKELWRCLGESV